MRMRIETKIRMAIRELGKGTERGPHNGAPTVMVRKWGGFRIRIRNGIRKRGET